MTYKYVCLGIVNPANAGKISWFHDGCALKMDVVAGRIDITKTTEIPPKGTKCCYCGKEISQSALRENHE